MADEENKSAPAAAPAEDDWTPSKDSGDKTNPEEKAKTGGGPRENRDAIPTAGGEKLGEKHWGESKFVPDNPKPVEESSGVASKDGQPTSEVVDNTAKNTGGATGGPATTDGEPKKSLVEKIKDKVTTKKE